MNIKVVWAFALISVCIFLAAADDNNDDNDSTRSRHRRYRRRRISTIAPEINENEEKGISVSVSGDVDASVNPPPYTVKKRYSKSKYAGVTINDGYDNNRVVVKKRLVKRKRVKTYTEKTPAQAEGQVVVSIKKRRRPVIKRKRVKSVYVNRRPYYKHKGFQAGIYVDYTTTEPPNVYIGPYNREQAVIKKDLRVAVDNNNDEDLEYVKPLPIKRKRISINTGVHVQKRPVVVAKKNYGWNVNYNKHLVDNYEYPPIRPVRVYKKKYYRNYNYHPVDVEGSAVVKIQKRPIIKRERVVVKEAPNVDKYDVDGYVDYNRKGFDFSINREVNVYGPGHDVGYNKDFSVDIQERKPVKRGYLFASAQKVIVKPKPVVKVAVGGTTAKLLEGPIRQAEIIDKAIKAIIAVVVDTSAKNVKIVEHRIANLFNFGVAPEVPHKIGGETSSAFLNLTRSEPGNCFSDNIGGVIADVKNIQLNNRRAIRDIILILSSSVDNTVSLATDGVGGAINFIGFGTKGEAIFRKTVECVVGTVKNVLWTKLNVLDYIYRIKAKFLTFGLIKPIAVIPNLQTKIGSCLKIFKV